MKSLLTWVRAHAAVRMLRNAIPLLGAVCVLGLPAPRAQPRQSAPTIVVAAEVHAKTAFPAPMPVVVGPPQAIPEGAYLLIRRVPPGATFSEGESLDAMTWIVSIADAPRLKITVADGRMRVAELTLVLARYLNDQRRGGVLAQTKVKLIVESPPNQEPRTQKAANSFPIRLSQAFTRPPAPSLPAYGPVRTRRPRRDG